MRLTWMFIIWFGCDFIFTQMAGAFFFFFLAGVLVLVHGSERVIWSYFVKCNYDIELSKGVLFDFDIIFHWYITYL